MMQKILPALAVLLILSSATFARADDSLALTPFAENLPPPIQFEGGTFLPLALEEAHSLRLHECERLQPRYLEIIKNKDLYWQKEMTIESARVRAITLREAKNIQVIDNNWQSWEVGILVGGFVIGALAVGAVTGAVFVTIY